MTYAEMRDYSLQLINQYTRVGVNYPLSYNNQADYVNKIPFLINDGLIYIASNVRKMASFVELDPDAGEEYGQWRRYILPEDYLSMRTGGLLIPEHKRHVGDREYMQTYRVQEPDYIMLPKWFKRPCILEYWRRPQMLSPNPTDTVRIDAPLDVQYAICFYVAAHLVMHDDAFLYASLKNEFEDKVSRLLIPVTTEVRTVTDVYGGDAEGAWDY